VKNLAHFAFGPASIVVTPSYISQSSLQFVCFPRCVAPLGCRIHSADSKITLLRLNVGKVKYVSGLPRSECREGASNSQCLGGGGGGGARVGARNVLLCGGEHARLVRLGLGLLAQLLLDRGLELGACERRANTDNATHVGDESVDHVNAQMQYMTGQHNSINCNMIKCGCDAEGSAQPQSECGAPTVESMTSCE
jgi:hypothetical protein